MADDCNRHFAGGDESWTMRDTMRRSEQLFRALTLYSGDIVSLLDADGRLLYNSPATERINGFTAADLAGIDTFELIHPDDRETVRVAFGAVIAAPGAVQTVRYRYRTKDGRWLWMEAIASNQLDNPAVRGVVANSRDISERVAAEQERRNLEAQMLHVQKLESLGVLAGGVAHDFNNLLTVVLGLASLMRDESDLGEIRQSAQKIELAAQQAKDLTHLLLAYAGKSRFEPEPTSLLETIEGSRSLLELSVSQQCSLVLDLDADVPAVQADPRQLRQLVLNMVQNGSEALTGDGEVLVELREVELAADTVAKSIVPSQLRAGDRAVRLRFADNGIGMDEATIARIFDPFFSTKRTGRGLGLAAVLGIARSHGAALTVRSEPGRGTTFDFWFPPSTVRPAHAATAAQQRFRTYGLALVVDDERGPAEVTCRMLGRIGIDATQASSGHEALTACRDGNLDLRLAIVDMIMPRMGGAETFRRLRELYPALPVLFCSGYDDNVAAECLQSPRTGFLRKPFDCDELASALRQLLTSD